MTTPEDPHASNLTQASSAPKGQRNADEPAPSSSSSYAVPAIGLPSGGGTLRAMDEAFDVDLVSGTASMKLPVPVTKIPRWGTPELSLQYDSGSGNGVFGLGWDLTGIPSISRRTTKGVPTYVNEDDVFIFGSEELVPMYATGKDEGFERSENGVYHKLEFQQGDFNIQRYRRRVDTVFDRIERWTKLDDTSTVHWRVITPHNVTQIFGRTRASQVALGDHIFSWHLCESYDPYGGAQCIEYKAEDGANIDTMAAHEQNRTQESRCIMKYIKRLKYGHQLPNRSSENWDDTTFPADMPSDQWMFELVLDYGEHSLVNPVPEEGSLWPVRQDPFSTCVSGFEIRTYRLCRRFLMFHRIPDELKRPSCLVTSLNLTYNESKTLRSDKWTASMAFLTAAQIVGYRPGLDDQYTTKSLPPLEFSYSQPTKDEELQKLSLQVIDEESMQNIGAGVTGPCQWLDLLGDGTTGILVQDSGALYYKRNLSAAKPSLPTTVKSDQSVFQPHVRFGPAESILTIPNLGSDQQSSVTISFTNLTGEGAADLMFVGQDVQGFYPRKYSPVETQVSWVSWGSFQSFDEWPLLDITDPDLRLIDLTGDGFADLLVTRDDKLLWYPSRGSRGFAPAREIALALDEEKGPRVLFSDANQCIYLADMSGDGMIDIVRIMNGQTCYWPSFGRGLFGAKVTMDNAPFFDSYESFSQSRVLMADIDGSGTTDILYFGPDGSFLYYNQSGNRWSDPVPLSGLIPRNDSLIHIAAVDLLSTGTTCLVWSSASIGAEGSPNRSLQYVDLMRGQKPHLLRSWTSNSGLETSIEYRTSASYCLQDEMEGQPWLTRLPFPVHCVERVQQYDRFSKNLVVSRYRYHNGYYNSIDREFCGFEVVEHWDTEQAQFTQNPDNIENIMIDPSTSFTVPTHTKSWYHMGALENAQLLYDRHAHDFYQPPDPQKSPHSWDMGDIYRDRISNLIGLDLSDEELRQAARALKGSLLHQEVFASIPGAGELPPYMTTSSGYSARIVQPKGQNEHAIFQIYQHESIKLRCEGDADDTAVTHSMNLAVDNFGNTTKSVNIAYGRNLTRPDQQPDLEEQDLSRQRKRYITYTEEAYTTLLESRGHYVTPLLYETSSYEISNFEVDSPRLTYGHFAGEEGSSEAFHPVALMQSIEYLESAPTNVASKRLLSCDRIRYQSDDLQKLLELGKNEFLALPGKSYQLCLTSNILDAFGYEGRNQKLEDDTLQAAGYVKEFNDGRWWTPSPVIRYSSSPTSELSDARKSFFRPVQSVDPFEAVTSVEYDQYHLLPVSSTDPMGNKASAATDFVTLEPGTCYDHNGNRTEVVRDALGVTVAIALCGKNDGTGDSVVGLEAESSDDQISGFIQDPLRGSKHLLAKASVRYVYDFQQSDRPAFMAQINAETNGESDDRAMQISIEYFDGFGRTAQHKAYVGDQKWLTSGWTVYSNKGLPIRQFENQFHNTPAFNADATSGSSTSTVYDGLNRPIATLYADHTWQKIVYGTWKVEVWDQNDTIERDPASDINYGALLSKLDTTMFRPSWLDARKPDQSDRHQQGAADKSRKLANTPSRHHTDANGSKFLLIKDTGNGLIKERYFTDIQGQLTTSVDGLGRIATSSVYDMGGRCIYSRNIDSGSRWTFLDINSNPVLGWDSLHRQIRHKYDKIGRPTHIYATEEGNEEICMCENVYGESLDEASAKKDNLRGQIFKIRDQSGVTTNQKYDYHGNCLLSQRQLASEYKTTIDLTHAIALESEISTTMRRLDALNRLVAEQKPDGSNVTYTYGQNTLLSSVAANLHSGEKVTYLSNIEYNAQGQEIARTLGNGSEVRMEYDDLTYRLIRKVLRTKNAKVLQDTRYVYDAAGNIVFITDQAVDDTFFRNVRVKAEQEYTYDAAYRLIAATGREQLGQTRGQPFSSSLPSSSSVSGNNLGPADGKAVAQYLESYEYDLAGNMLTLKHEISDSKMPGWTRRYQYSEPSLIEEHRTSNRLSQTTVGSTSEQYKYDAVGNCVSMPGMLKATWSIDNKLASSTTQVVNDGTPETVWYVYGSSGSRVRKVVERFDPSGQSSTKLSEMTSIDGSEHYIKYDGHGKTDLECRTLHMQKGPDENIVLVERWSGPSQATKHLPTLLTRYQHTSHTGSVNAEQDENEQQLSYEEYSPYGSTTFRSALTKAPKRYRFAGKERDHETGFYYVGARYYIPWLARWLSPDPLMIKDGLNVYEYVGCNPIGYIDPTGTTKKKKQQWTRMELAASNPTPEAAESKEEVKSESSSSAASTSGSVSDSGGSDSKAEIESTATPPSSDRSTTPELDPTPTPFHWDEDQFGKYNEHFERLDQKPKNRYQRDAQALADGADMEIQRGIRTGKVDPDRFIFFDVIAIKETRAIADYYGLNTVPSSIPQTVRKALQSVDRQDREQYTHIWRVMSDRGASAVTPGSEILFVMSRRQMPHELSIWHTTELVRLRERGVQVWIKYAGQDTAYKMDMKATNYNVTYNVRNAERKPYYEVGSLK